MSPILRIQPWEEIDNRHASLDLVHPMGTKDTEVSLIRQQTEQTRRLPCEVSWAGQHTLRACVPLCMQLHGASSIPLVAYGIRPR